MIALLLVTLVPAADPPETTRFRDSLFLWTAGEGDRPATCEALLIAPLAEMRSMSGPVWSPDESSIAITIQSPRGKSISSNFDQMFVLDVDDGSLRPLGPGKVGSWPEPNRLLFGTTFPEGHRVKAAADRFAPTVPYARSIDPTIDLSSRIDEFLPMSNLWQSEATDPRSTISEEQLGDLSYGHEPRLFDRGTKLLSVLQLTQTRENVSTTVGPGCVTDAVSGEIVLLQTDEGDGAFPQSISFDDARLLDDRHLIARTRRGWAAPAEGEEEELRILRLPDWETAPRSKEYDWPHVTLESIASIPLSYLRGPIRHQENDESFTAVHRFDYCAATRELSVVIATYWPDNAANKLPYSYTVVQVTLDPSLTSWSEPKVLLRGWPDVRIVGIAVSQDGRRMAFTTNAFKVLGPEGELREPSDLIEPEPAESGPDPAG